MCGIIAGQEVEADAGCLRERGNRQGSIFQYMTKGGE
jgi:hypothetical protein